MLLLLSAPPALLRVRPWMPPCNRGLACWLLSAPGPLLVPLPPPPLPLPAAALFSDFSSFAMFSDLTSAAAFAAN